MTRVAAIQMTSCADVARNLASADVLLREARTKGARIAALPENFAYMGLTEADKIAIAETAWRRADPVVPRRDGGRAGALDRRGHRAASASRNEPRVAAACLVFDDRGRAVARYDKIHLFDVGPAGPDESYRESSSVRARRSRSRRRGHAGRAGSASRSATTCAFPSCSAQLLSRGADWFCLPSAFTAPTGRAHWEVLLRARAIENLCHVVAPAQSGFHENGRETYGDSMIVDCWGRVLARLPRGTGVVTAELDLVRQREVRQNFPAVHHRRLWPEPGTHQHDQTDIPPRCSHPSRPRWSRLRRPGTRSTSRAPRCFSPRQLDENRVASVLGRRDGSRRRLRRRVLPVHARGVVVARGRHRQGRRPQHRAGRRRARAGGREDRLRVLGRSGAARRCSKRRTRRARSRARGADGRRAGLARHGRPRALPPIDPVESLDDGDKVRLLEDIDREARALDPRITQVMASLSASHDTILVLASDGTLAADVRPLVRLNVERDHRAEWAPRAGLRGRRRTLRLHRVPGLANAGARSCARPCARRWSTSRRCRRRPAR